MDKYNKYYNSYPLNLCADSGYGIFDNYEYIKGKFSDIFLKAQDEVEKVCSEDKVVSAKWHKQYPIIVSTSSDKTARIWSVDCLSKI